ncbi:hypothetical protein BHM03_00008054 [Ensete ventricosum]|nr:hypothetical protein BHM03_00008054 [Ensete ventricosum]
MEVTQRSTTVPQRRIYQSRRKGYRCKVTDSSAMGLTAPWYRRGETFMESSIPYSQGGRALVVKGTEEVKNAEANSNNLTFSTTKRIGEVEYPSSLTYPAEKLCISSVCISSASASIDGYRAPSATSLLSSVTDAMKSRRKRGTVGFSVDLDSSTCSRTNVTLIDTSCSGWK